MKRRALKLRRAAIRDLAARERLLARERGAVFAQRATDQLLAWLARVADGGAELGTAHDSRAGMRTFGYRRQATVLVRYTATEMQVVRVYFRGRDWQR